MKNGEISIPFDRIIVRQNNTGLIDATISFRVLNVPPSPRANLFELKKRGIATYYTNFLCFRWGGELHHTGIPDDRAERHLLRR